MMKKDEPKILLVIDNCTLELAAKIHKVIQEHNDEKKADKKKT